MPYRGRYSDLSHKNNRLNRFNFIKNSKKGAILIEFAFAVPILFSFKDLNYARALAGLTYYGGTTHYAVNKDGWRSLGSCLVFYMYLVEGTGHNRCKLKWAIDGSQIHDTPDDLMGMGEFSGNTYNSRVRYSANDTESSSIYESLQIEKDQVKIILDLCIWMGPDDKMADGTSVGAIPILKRFGLHIVSPRKIDTRSHSYFHSVVIFTPKPGLFDPNKPPQ